MRNFFQRTNSTIKKATKHMLTEPDNETYDVAKFLAVLSVIAAIVFQGHNVLITHIVFDMQNFGIGIGALFAGVAAALGFKKDTPIE